MIHLKPLLSICQAPLAHVILWPQIMAAKKKKQAKTEDAPSLSVSQLAVPFDMPIPSEFLTKDDLIKYLKISRPTINRLMKQKAFPFIKLARRVLFRKADIDRFLESKTVK
jgi:excisionase family DNA binding protein